MPNKNHQGYSAIIADSIKVLLVGRAGCIKVCLSGGEKETEVLAAKYLQTSVSGMIVPEIVERTRLYPRDKLD